MLPVIKFIKNHTQKIAHNYHLVNIKAKVTQKMSISTYFTDDIKPIEQPSIFLRVILGGWSSFASSISHNTGTNLSCYYHYRQNLEDKSLDSCYAAFEIMSLY